MRVRLAVAVVDRQELIGEGERLFRNVENLLVPQSGAEDDEPLHVPEGAVLPSPDSEPSPGGHLQPRGELPPDVPGS